jgi:hypothetical protein
LIQILDKCGYPDDLNAGVVNAHVGGNADADGDIFGDGYFDDFVFGDGGGYEDGDGDGDMDGDDGAAEYGEGIESGVGSSYGENGRGLSGKGLVDSVFSTSPKRRPPPRSRTGCW